MLELRKKKKLTQGELGRMVGLTQGMISQHERGLKAIADIRKLGEMAEILDCNVADIAEPGAKYDPRWVVEVLEMSVVSKIQDQRTTSRIRDLISMIRKELAA